MNTKIFQNSYVMFLVSFIVLCLIFYFFKIGYTTEISNGKVTRKFGWRYPLAISLIIWLIWHFYLYPPHDGQLTSGNTTNYNQPANQKIILSNWN